MRPARRLVLRASTTAAPAEAWRVFCRRVLSLSDAETARLMEKLSGQPAITLVEPVREALLKPLERGGMIAGSAEAPTALAACARHPALVGTEICPVCKERRACVLCLIACAEERCPRCAGRRRFATGFRNLRIAVLLAIFVAIAAGRWWIDRGIASWSRPLTVSIVPVNADPEPAVADWTSRLGPEDFQDAADFLQGEAARHGVRVAPVVRFGVTKPIGELPPETPAAGASVWSIAAWSLKLRFWGYRTAWKESLPSATIRIFVLYGAPESERPLESSVGLQKLHLGVVHTRAGEDDAPWTNLAVTHELLHTVGASDHYDPQTLQVRIPQGIAEPARQPLFPQALADVMAGRVPVSPTESYPVQTLRSCIVGPVTASEIHWPRP